MRATSFVETDTLLIELNSARVTETKDLGEYALVDVDASGNICAITIEHATERAGLPECSFESIGP